jgi:hypothetical protein
MISRSEALGHAPGRWMQFIDGKSFTDLALKLLRGSNYEPLESDSYKKDCFLWPGGDKNSLPHPPLAEPWPVRSFYYTAVSGNEDVRADAREKIRNLGFEPHVFSNDKQAQKSNGADIALTGDMLSNAFRGNYEIAVLVSGNGEYVPLVEEVKRLGKRVHVHFFGGHAHPELKLVADAFEDITPMVLRWGFRSENSAAMSAFDSR